MILFTPATNLDDTNTDYYIPGITLEGMSRLRVQEHRAFLRLRPDK